MSVLGGPGLPVLVGIRRCPATGSSPTWSGRLGSIVLSAWRSLNSLTRFARSVALGGWTPDDFPPPPPLWISVDFP